MKKLLKINLLVFVSLVIFGCANTDDESPTSKAIVEKISFKKIANVWFEQDLEDVSPSPEDVNFDFDADEDMEAFDGLLESNIVEDST